MAKDELAFVIQERGKWVQDYPEYGVKDVGTWHVVVDNRGYICGGYPTKQMAMLAIPRIKDVLEGKVKIDVQEKKFYSKKKGNKNDKNNKRTFQKKEGKS